MNYLRKGRQPYRKLCKTLTTDTFMMMVILWIQKVSSSDGHITWGVIRCTNCCHSSQTLSSSWCAIADLGWGLLSQFSPFRYFPHFPLLSKQTLAIGHHVYTWQVSPQLSCGDTCQIWMWFRESNRYFWKIENFAYGEISERSFSNPHPSPVIVQP